MGIQNALVHGYIISTYSFSDLAFCTYLCCIISNRASKTLTSLHLFFVFVSTV